MAITGKFEADFDSFYTAVEGANLRLKTLTEGGAKVETQMNRVADSLSGRKLINDATIMSAAVEKLGGVSTLTAAELGRLGPQAEQAVAKMRALGTKEIPDTLLRIASASRETTNGFTEASQVIGKFDNVLQLFGVNLAPVRTALHDLGTLAGSSSTGVAAMGTAAGATTAEVAGMGTASAATAVGIGAMGTAAGVAGAAIGGWTIGRKIAELLDLDQTIADSTAKILGWGDAVAQAAASKAETLAKASKIAGFAIHDLGTAIVILTAAAKDQETALGGAASAEEQYEKGATAGWEAMVQFNEEVARFRASGHLWELTRDLKANVQSQADLATQYGLSAAAVAAFGKEVEHAGSIEAANAAKLETLRMEWTKAEATRGARMQAAEDAKTKALYDEIDAQTNANQAAHDKMVAAMDAEEAIKRKVEETNAALKKQADAAAAVARAIGSTVEYDLSTPEGMARFKRMNPGATVSAPAEYFQTHSLAQGIAQGVVRLGYGAATGSAAFDAAQYAQQGSSAAPPVVIAPYSPRAARSPASADSAPPVVVHVSGVFDVASTAALTKAVGKGTARRVGESRVYGWG